MDIFSTHARRDKLGVMEDFKRLSVVLFSYRGNMYCGGQGVYLTNLARALVSRGHRVRMISGPPYPEPVPGAELELLPGENFVNKQARALPGRGLSIFGPMNLFEYGLARTGANPEMLASSLRCFQRIKQLLKNERVDVVHDNQGLGYGLLLIKRLGPPVVSTIHHPLQVDRAEDVAQTFGLVKKARRAIYYPPFMQRAVARRLERIITVSRFSKELVARTYGIPESRMRVVQNGVDTGIFRPLPGVEPEPGRLLFVGSTEDRKKGVAYLLGALGRLPPRFRLVIADGRMYPGRVYARELVKSLGLGSRVTFLEKTSNAGLVKEYNRAWMLVAPSLFEGFGLPALEAMACGTPVLCTSAGALPEVVDEKCAVVVDPRSSKAIEAGIIEMDKNGFKREGMSRAGRERAVSMFSWDTAARMVEEEYLRSIRENRTRF